MKRFSISLVMIATLAGGALQLGCATDGSITNEQGDLEYQQKYDMEYVQEHAAELQPGMSKAEVLILLGSPAEQQPAKWIYRPKRSALIVPAEALVVRFDQGRYVSHRTEAIVLGERLGDS